MMHEKSEEADAGRTQPARKYLTWGPALLVIGLFVMAIVWTVMLLKEIPDAYASMVWTIAVILVLVGAFLTVMSHSMDRLASKLISAVAGPITFLARQVQVNTSNIARLMEARSVDLRELRQELDEAVEGASRVVKREAMDEVAKRFDELDLRFGRLETGLADLARQRDAADAQYMVDMAKSVQLGRDIERGNQSPPGA